MKTNSKRSKIALKKVHIARIDDLSYIKGGKVLNRLFWPISASDHPLCSIGCEEHQQE